MSLLSPPFQAFLAVEKMKTVHAASTRLGITQTGVTQRIRTLEKQLGVTLFTRSRRGMLLTHEGEALLRYCQSALELEGEAMAQITGAGTKSSIQISILGPTSLMRTRVIPGCLPLHKKFPNLSFAFQIVDQDSGASSLRSGQSQMAILRPEEVAKEMESRLLKPEQYVLVGAKSWKNRILKRVLAEEQIIDFDVSDDTTQRYLNKFNLLQHARVDRHFVNNNEALLQLLEQGWGYGVLTQEFADQALRQNRLVALNEGRTLENRLALAWYPRPQMPLYFRSILDAIR